jgi:DMSO/TMAO reductase YedYZ molybdopterin-dependent catalytic subunit
MNIRVLSHVNRKSFLLFILLLSSNGLAQDITLTVTGEVKTPLKFTMTQIKALSSTQVTVKDHNGSTVTYTGIFLADILHQAGVPQGEALRGHALQLCVLAKAADGYQATFSLAELDPLFTDKKAILAYLRDGRPLDNNAGPLRIIIPDEKRQGRWVRQVTGLEIIKVNSPK